MTLNPSLKMNLDIKNSNPLIQTIILNKSDKNIKPENSNKKRSKENTINDLDISFKVNKFGYYNVKKKSKVYFAQGKINLKTEKDKDNNINLTFYDTSLNLRFQGIINTKKSSFIVDINNENCVIINELIGFIFYIDENGLNKYDMIMTNIYIFFQKKEDMDNLFNLLC